MTTTAGRPGSAEPPTTDAAQKQAGPSITTAAPERALTREELNQKAAEWRRRTKTVPLPDGGGAMTFRALTQEEVDDVNEPLLVREVSDDGGVTGRSDNRGWRTRAVVKSAVNGPNLLTPMFPDYEQGLREVGAWPRTWVDAGFEAVDELSVLTTSARKKLGKG